MKLLKLTAVLLLFGCAPSTSALVENAQITGDWSLVDKRDAAMDRREIANEPGCRKGSTMLCVRRLGHEDCRCIADSQFRQRLERTVRGSRGKRALP